MKELIEKILAHFPQYIGNFGSVLASPTRFLEKQIGPPQDRMSASLTFLAISAVLVVIVGASRRPPGQELWTAVANVAQQLSRVSQRSWAAWGSNPEPTD